LSDPDPVVICIEDDPQMRRFLRTGLTAQGFRVCGAETGREGLAEAAARKPDLVILDLGLPDMDGVEVVRELRTWSAMPVIVLSARTMEKDKIRALDAGADDYLTKPFGLGELLARMRVALRHAADRAGPGHEGEFAAGDLHVDLARRLVRLGGAPLHLTPIEYRLLAVLIRNAGRVLTHRQLLKEVWGPSHVDRSHYLRVYMAQLRHKLERDPARPKLLLTEPGVGYRLWVE
jgi:two-component system KDP operon response regulator KdpE